MVRDGKALVFDHPEAGTEFVKGTVEPGESIETAVLRELAEESGLRDATLVERIGVWEGMGQLEVGRNINPEPQRWHIWLVELHSDPGEHWVHRADEGHEYRFRWVEVGLRLLEEIHPLQRPVAEMLVESGLVRGGPTETY